MSSDDNHLSPHQKELMVALLEGGVSPGIIKRFLPICVREIWRHKRAMALGKPMRSLRGAELTQYINGIIAEVRQRHNPRKRS